MSPQQVELLFVGSLAHAFQKRHRRPLLFLLWDERLLYRLLPYLLPLHSPLLYRMRFSQSLFVLLSALGVVAGFSPVRPSAMARGGRYVTELGNSPLLPSVIHVIVSNPRA